MSHPWWSSCRPSSLRLQVRPGFVALSFLHNPIVGHDIGCCCLGCYSRLLLRDPWWWTAIRRDSGQQFPWGSLSRKGLFIHRTCPLSSFLLRRLFSAVSVSSLSAGDSRNAGSARNIAGGVGTRSFFLTPLLQPWCIRCSLSSVAAGSCSGTWPNDACWSPCI